MPSPPSHLDADALEPVRRLAQALREAAAALGALADGGTSAVGGGVSGRAGDAAVALRRWSGPLRDRFVALTDHEAALAATIRIGMAVEADEWERFRTQALVAHQARLRAEAGAPPLTDQR